MNGSLAKKPAILKSYFTVVECKLIRCFIVCYSQLVYPVISFRQHLLTELRLPIDGGLNDRLKRPNAKLSKVGQPGKFLLQKSETLTTVAKTIKYLKVKLLFSISKYVNCFLKGITILSRVLKLLPIPIDKKQTRPLTVSFKKGGSTRSGVAAGRGSHGPKHLGL